MYKSSSNILIILINVRLIHLLKFILLFFILFGDSNGAHLVRNKREIINNDSFAAVTSSFTTVERPLTEENGKIVIDSNSHSVNVNSNRNLNSDGIESTTKLRTSTIESRTSTTTDVNNVIPQDYDSREHLFSTNNDSEEIRKIDENQERSDFTNSNKEKSSYSKDFSHEQNITKETLPLKVDDKHETTIASINISQKLDLISITPSSTELSTTAVTKNTNIKTPSVNNSAIEKITRIDSRQLVDRILLTTSTPKHNAAIIDIKNGMPHFHTFRIKSTTEALDSPEIEVKTSLINPEISTEKRGKYLIDANLDFSKITSEETWVDLKTIGEVNYNNVSFGRTADIEESTEKFDHSQTTQTLTSSIMLPNKKKLNENSSSFHNQKIQLNSNSSLDTDDSVHQDISITNNSFQMTSTSPISLTKNALNDQKLSTEESIRSPVENQTESIQSYIEKVTFPIRSSSSSTPSVVVIVSTTQRRSDGDLTIPDELLTTEEQQLSTTDHTNEATLLDTITTPSITTKAITFRKMDTTTPDFNKTHSPIISNIPSSTKLSTTTDSITSTEFITTLEPKQSSHLRNDENQVIEKTTISTDIFTSTPAFDKNNADFITTNIVEIKSHSSTHQPNYVEFRPTERVNNHVEKHIENSINVETTEKDDNQIGTTENEIHHHDIKPTSIPGTTKNVQPSTIAVVQADTSTSTETIDTTSSSTSTEHSITTEIPPIESPSQSGNEGYPEPKETDVNAMIAISISVVSVITLILLVGFLVVMRKRQKQLTYGQRCRPVGLDAYSLDNISVYNSVRRKSAMRTSKRGYGNAAFDDPSLKNNLLSISQLAAFVQKRNTIYEEFRDIPLVIARIDEVPAGCEDKNRYANIVPLPESRVHLKRIDDDEKTEYINANYVKGPKDTTRYYIACQAPLENTIIDFWRMIWEQNSRVIIMATDLTENGIEKCAEYLPPSFVIDNHITFGDYHITLKNREVRDKYAVSTVHLKNLITKSWREVTHLWYQWPETGMPTDEASIIAMLLEARSYLKMVTPEQTTSDQQESDLDLKIGNGNAEKMKSLPRDQGPLTVHCSPGTGRTGTIIACDIAIRALEQPTRSVDIPQTVYVVRRGRASAVQIREQYEFIYKVAHMYATKLTGPINEN